MWVYGTIKQTKLMEEEDDFISELEGNELLEQIVCPNCDNTTFTVFKDPYGRIERLICDECETRIDL